MGKNYLVGVWGLGSGWSSEGRSGPVRTMLTGARRDCKETPGGRLGVQLGGHANWVPRNPREIVRRLRFFASRRIVRS